VIDKRELETVTSLLISQADESDSGRYTCDPASAYSQSIVVHVTQGTYLIFFGKLFSYFDDLRYRCLVMTSNNTFCVYV
jgi:hypothetical protein